MRPLAKILFAVLPLVLATGCGPGYLTVRTPLTIDTTGFAGVHVEQESDKSAFADGFSSGLRTERGPLDVSGEHQPGDGYLVRSNVEVLEPGVYNGLLNAPTVMRTRVTVIDANRAPLDELEVRCLVTADLYRPTLGTRMAECGRITGYRVARYLRGRVAE